MSILHSICYLLEKNYEKFKLFLDGPNLKEIKKFKNKIDGFTFNPSLFKKLSAKDYIGSQNKYLKIVKINMCLWK